MTYNKKQKKEFEKQLTKHLDDLMKHDLIPVSVNYALLNKFNLIFEETNE